MNVFPHNRKVGAFSGGCCWSGWCHQGSIIYKQPPFVSHTHQDSSLPSSCAFIKCFPTAKLKKNNSGHIKLVINV